MELLIFCRQYYNGDETKQGHWLDTAAPFLVQKINARTDLSPAQQIKAIANIDNKYHARAISGDISEEHDDGWWDDLVLKKGKNKRMLECYACIKLPGVKRTGTLALPVLGVNDKYIHGYRYQAVVVPAVGTSETRSGTAAGIFDKVDQKLVLLQVIADG